MWLEQGTAKSLVCRYNEQHRQGLQSYSVSAAAFALGGLCLMHHWGLSEDWCASNGCVGGIDNTGTRHALGVLSANVMNEELSEGCTLEKQGRKPTCVPVILADIGTPLAYRCRAHI